jgi:hypothetical protein
VSRRSAISRHRIEALPPAVRRCLKTRLHRHGDSSLRDQCGPASRARPRDELIRSPRRGRRHFSIDESGDTSGQIFEPYETSAFGTNPAAKLTPEHGRPLAEPVLGEQLIAAAAALSFDRRSTRRPTRRPAGPGPVAGRLVFRPVRVVSTACLTASGSSHDGPPGLTGASTACLTASGSSHGGPPGAEGRVDGLGYRPKSGALSRPRSASSVS